MFAVAVVHAPSPVTWPSIVLAVLGIAGLAGAAVVYFRSTVSKASVENYREAYESMKARMEVVEVEVKDAQEHATRCDAELKAHKTAYEMLADQVRGTAAIASLGDKLEERLDTLIGSHQQMAKDLTEGQDHMAEAVGGLVVDLRKKFGLDEMDRRQ